MNRLRSVEMGRKAAAVTTALIGMVSLAGCGFSMKGPDLKPETKAKLEHILKPAAVKAARKVIKFSHTHDPIYSYVSRDEDTPNGYEISVDGLKPDSPRIEAYMLGHKEKGKVVLEPETTYYIEVNDTMSFGQGDEHYSNEVISSTEESPYSRKVWCTLGYSEEDKKGKTTNQILADTHRLSKRFR